MRVPPSILDEIRAVLPVSRIVGRHVKLRRQGREHVGLSPFKCENTPSFTVNDAKGFFHCFASGEHGDIFAFLMKVEGLSFTEAVEQLAAEAGITLPTSTPEAVAREGAGARLRKLMEAACAFFQANLRGEAGAAARAYLERRGVTTAEIDSFRLGYAPAHERGNVIVAEGYMDVIALARAGFPNAVAPLGTALTPDQLHMLWRMAPEPVVCFDGDAAGIKAAHRAAETALPLLKPGQSLAFAFLLEGFDPDDLLRQHGASALSQALAGARPLVDVLWAKELGAGTWDTPERRAKLDARLFELVRTIGDRTVRGHYEDAIRRRLREQFAPQRAAAPLRQAPRSPDRAGGKKLAPTPRRAHSVSLADNALVRPQPDGTLRGEMLLLQMILAHPWLLDSQLEQIAALTFGCQAVRDIRNRIVAIYSEAGEIDRETLAHELRRCGHADPLASSSGLAATEAGATREDIFQLWQHRLAMHRRAVELPRELEAAGRELAAEFSEQNWQRMMALHAQIFAVNAGC